MRRSNEQRLRVGLCKQLASLPCRGAEDGIDDRSLLLRGYGNGLVHGCVLRRFEKENLVQAESQDVADVGLDV
jgi:hypothetical protein